MVEYRYIGDRLSDPRLKGKECRAVRRNDKCVRGRNGSMLVEFPNIGKVVLIGRLLRKLIK